MAVTAMPALSDHDSDGVDPDPGAATPFILSGPDETRVGVGVAALVAPTPAERLNDAVAAFWASQTPGASAQLLVGALPFDRAAPAHLYAPRTVAHAWPAPADAAWRAAPGNTSSAAEPPPAAYAEAVQSALALLENDGVRGHANLLKVVLARSLLVTAPVAIDTNAVLARLARDPSVTTYALPLPGAPSRTLIGASPELLVDKRGVDVRSAPLAGSARRHADKGADDASAAGLLDSPKDRREHGFVVEAILDTLTPYCRSLKAPSSPSLVSTASMWHLGTQIDGVLKDKDVSVIALATALHPTPAVCGLPREAARQAIATLEDLDRGFYAGAVGWADRNGDGRWMVAIRCAEFAGRTARLYAGAGIVPGSDPWSEVAETSAKFVALLSALGIEEAGSAETAHT